MNEWTLYILRCRNNSLYTGITKNLKQRLEKHNTGKGAKYTRANGPCTIVYSENKLTETQAKKKEALIKKMSKQEKEKLIKT